MPSRVGIRWPWGSSMGSPRCAAMACSSRGEMACSSASASASTSLQSSPSTRLRKSSTRRWRRITRRASAMPRSVSRAPWPDSYVIHFAWARRLSIPVTKGDAQANLSGDPPQSDIEQPVGLGQGLPNFSGHQSSRVNVAEGENLEDRSYPGAEPVFGLVEIALQQATVHLSDREGRIDIHN